ncbi:MAG: diguanylate cyclase [Pseudonocardiaceae bacterium]|nr:diguanylate cyclase [Pseudonocardiaceae bacterium]
MSGEATPGTLASTYSPDGNAPAPGDDDESSGFERANLVRLHESIAALLAAREQWREAYAHLRSALDLVQTEGRGVPAVPEQFRREVDQLRREHAEAREQSIRDSLTDSYNRRYLDQRLVALLTEQEQASGGLGVALVDLDWFKQVNDEHGHLVGDRVLQRVVELLQADLPEGAFCARYGGEEFVLVLPGIDDAHAVRVAESARARVADYPWHTIALNLRVTVSIGLAEANPPPPVPETSALVTTPPERQLLRADDLLYAAKRSGRNAVAYCEGGQVRLAGAAARRRTDPSRLVIH